MQISRCLLKITLTPTLLGDIMTNAWSLLYDVMEEMNSFSIIPADTKDWEDFWNSPETYDEWTIDDLKRVWNEMEKKSFAH